MNKITKISLAILLGIETVYHLLSPIMLVLLWGFVVGFDSDSSKAIIFLGSITSITRAIKIGFLKQNG